MGIDTYERQLRIELRRCQRHIDNGGRPSFWIWRLTPVAEGLTRCLRNVEETLRWVATLPEQDTGTVGDPPDRNESDLQTLLTQARARCDEFEDKVSVLLSALDGEGLPLERTISAEQAKAFLRKMLERPELSPAEVSAALLHDNQQGGGR